MRIDEAQKNKSVIKEEYRRAATVVCRCLSWLPLFVELLLPARSFAQTWTHVQGTSVANASHVTSLTATLPSNPGTGHDVIVGIEFDCCSSVPTSSVSVHDANGNWYTMSPRSPFLDPRNGRTESLYFFYLLNAPSNASQTIHITWTTGIDAVAWADEFSSSSGAAAFDTDTGAVNIFGGSTINFPSITPAGSGELLYALTLPNAVLAAPAAGASLGSWIGAAGGIDNTTTGGMAEYDLNASSTTAPNFTDAISGDTTNVALLAIAPQSGIFTPAPSTCGNLSQLGTDSGDALYQLGVPCITGPNAGGYTVSSVSYWVGSPTSTSFDLGVYADSSGSPGALLCHASTGTITPTAGWNSVNISGCPALSSGTLYWMGYITGSNPIQQGTTPGACPGVSFNNVWANNTQSAVSLANPFGASTQETNNRCYSMHMTLNPVAVSNACGETTQSGIDSGNSNYGWGTPCKTGSNAGGYAVSRISYWVGTPTASTSFDLGVYSDSSGSPGALLCHASTGTITPTVGWNSVNISGCPTLSASTPYWVGYVNGSDQIVQGTVSGNCPGTSNYSVYTSSRLSGVSLASPFGANGATSSCYSMYMTLSTGSLPTPTLTVSSSVNPSSYGQSVSLTAAISSGPTGLVNFYSDGVEIGQAAISGSTATLMTSGLPLGSHSITASWPGNASYNPVSSSAVTQTINVGTPVITWATPAPLSYSQPLSATQLNATANVPGTFVYTPASGTVLSPGTHTLSVTFTPTDTTDYTPATATVTLHVPLFPSAGIITTIVGNGYEGNSGDGGQAINAEMIFPESIAVDSAGNIYIPDSTNNVVREVSASTGIITTIAGTGTQGYAGDGGPATNAQLNSPFAVAVDASGNVYIADTNNNRIRKITVSTGVITTVAGTGASGFFGDNGPATNAHLSYPSGVAVDNSGNLYIADTGNNAVREVTTSTGIITSVAGNSFSGHSGDGGPATGAELWGPCAIAFDASGNLYIADAYNQAIREVNHSTGNISTIAGNGTAGYAGDGGPATSAELYYPYAISVDAVGNLYISDYENFRIRMISSTTGIISTVAGTGTAGYSGDGGPATSAELSYPYGVVVDPAGNLYIADCGNHVVRVVGGASQAQVTVSVSPSSATLYASQQQQFSATVTNTTNTAVTWSISPSNAGSINSSGLYTAPTTISTQQTITVTATSQANPAISASATVTLMPIISVSVSPSTVSLYGGQSQSFSATVTGSSNTAVTWSISPAGSGTIDASGNYTAPATITTQQAVTVTATSQADTTKSVTATVYLLAPCSTNGFGFVRPIVIDHTKVPNTDQTDFPFLFSGIYPYLATASNGGNVQSANGYDIVFSADPGGQTKLDYEIEKYSSTTGQIIAWVRVPTLAHGVDTVLYLLYGNAGVATSQANPAGVWKSGYVGVYHLADGNTLNLNDSSGNQNNLANDGVLPTNGEIDGAASFNGSNFAYRNSPTALPTGTSERTLSAWIQMAAPDANKEIVGWGDNLQVGDRWSMWWTGGGIGVEGLNAGAFANMAYDTNWHYVALASPEGNSSFANASIFIDGVQQPLASSVGSINTTGAVIGLGTIPGALGNDNFKGNLDEVRISNVARSWDWTAAEFNNQNSPSTFYSVDANLMILVEPASASLYAGQSEQFAAAELQGTTCAQTAALWSMPPGSPGTLSSDGLYTAPANISASQSVTVIATSPVDPTKTGAATVTLLPKPLSPILTLRVSVQPPYVAGTTQQFVATFTNLDGSPLSGATVTFNVSGVNGTSGTGTTDNYGNTSFTYIGSNSGLDSIQANATFDGLQATSNTISVTWIVPAQAISSTTVTGRFFQSDNSGFFDLMPGATPLFTQTFPNINFDINDGPRPFTDATTDVNGIVTGTIIAQGNGYQAGCPAVDNLVPDYCNSTLAGNINAFEAVFTGSFVVASAGNVTFNFYVDDSFILGIGNGATRVGGAAYNMPAVTPFQQYPAMGADNRTFQAASDQIVVNFPAPGTYPYEVDYSECCGLGLALSMTQGASNSAIPPATSLALTPSTVSAQPLGTNLPFTVQAMDPTGAPVANLPVELRVVGATAPALSGTTDSTGRTTITLSDVYSSLIGVQATANIAGVGTYSNMVAIPPALASQGGSNGGGRGTLTLSVSSATTVVLPGALQLIGTATDTSLPQGDTISYQWTQVSGPGTVTFADSNQPSTTASFSQQGTYVLQLKASDDVSGSAAAQLTIAVDPAPGVPQGWIGSPIYGSQVSCIVPITVGSGETLASGVLTFYPANNPNAVTVLNADTTGSGQIGLFDTTQLNNGTYWITLQATDTSGNSEYNLDLVTVGGNCKPGRITSTVTDLVVPAKGLPINIQRTYDSLNASTVGDFGYGWNLSINVNLVVDEKNDVAFTLGGLRKTFYFTPQNPSCGTLIGCVFPWYFPVFTPEPGFHGTLTASGDGCALGLLGPDGECYGGGGYYTPTGYIYTDPSGTQYSISANGNLQSITDKNGNALTITPNGITSSTGLSVPFTRDSSGRITEITDPQGNHYQYSYDDNGNLASVTYPTITQPSTYTYDGNHRYLSGTDFRGNSLPSTAYYGPTDTDTNGLPLNGRLKSVTDALGETTSYAYNLDTNTTTITYPPDANGNTGTATMVYDTSGDVLISTDPLGHTTSNTYDASLNLLSTTDPLSHVTRYTYDSNGNKTSTAYPATATSSNTTSTTTYNQYSEPTQTTDEDGNTRTFNYDVNFDPQSVTDNLGTLASFAFNTDGTMQSGAVGYDIGSQPSMGSQFIYDTNGNLASRTDALGRTTSYTYDSLGHKLTMTEPLPNTNTSASAATTSYTYDDFGNLTQTSAPLGRVTSSTYDGNNNKISDTDARGNTTTYTYDALNRLILTTYPDTTTAGKTYDFRGNVVTETDQAGHVTKHVYDLAGRETSVTHAYGTSNATTTSYTYDNAGRKITETDALSHTTNYTYDAAGNLTGVSGVGGSFTYAYDNARNRVSMTDGNGHTTGYQYDARKRLTTTIYPDATSKTNAYDGPGNLVSVTDQAGNVVEYTYDAANQLQKVTQANSPNSPANTTIVGYDADGNPIALEDANTHITASSFDLVNELTGKTLPDGSLTESRTYDNNGNLLTVTHFNGVVTTYTYDTLNRLLSRATPGETTVGFTYTATGKRHTMTDASGTTTYSYDAMDRLTQKATPEGTLAYTYDSAGHLASMVSNHTNGVSVAYTYDSLNRLSTEVDNRLSGSNTTTYTYDDANNVATVTYPNNVQTTFTYDDLNRVTGLGSSLGNYSYQLGATGNRTSASEPNGRSVTWSYDGIYRLTNEAITGAPSGKNGSVGYGLDPVGNRTSASSSITGLAPVSGSFNPDDQLSAETYDQNGNVLTTGGKTFAYDAENHLMSMGTTVGLLYDGDGNRVAKSVSGTATYYLVDDLNPTGYPQVVEELSGTGAVTRQYTYGLLRISEQQAISNTWTPSFYGYDGGGSARALTNSAGAVTDTYDYDAFGNKINSTGSTPNSYLYRGEYLDSDLGLYYLRARYMNPLTGRFMGRDPGDGDVTEPPTLHKYVYANSDPVNGADPTGWGDDEDYPLALGTISASAEAEAGLAALQAAIACAYIWEGTKTAAQVIAGPFGSVETVSPCIVLPRKPGTPPAFPPFPLPLPISPIGPNWPQRKFDQCREIDDQIDAIKKNIRASGGACTEGMSGTELAYLASLWAEEVEARETLHQQCFQNEADAGHQKALQQAKDNLAACQDIPPAP